MTINKIQLIKTIYFYLVSLIGLMMIVFPSAQLINLGLKTWIFTKADDLEKFYAAPPIPISERGGITEIKSIQSCKNTCEFSDEQKQSIANWLEDYEKWQKNSQNQEGRLVAQRQRDAVTAISFLAVGIPLFWLHWRIIKKEKVKK